MPAMSPLPSNEERRQLLNPDKEAQALEMSNKVKNRFDVFNLGRVTLITIYYAFCSSTMLVINKVAVHHVPAPTFVLFSQLAFSAAAVWVLDLLRVVEADKLEWHKARNFIVLVGGFLCCLFANIKVLQHANVETFITFRSSTPLIMAACDYVFLGRAWPNGRSIACLLVLLAGSAGYVMVDASFKVTAYLWLAAWYFFFVFDTVYVKHTIETVKMTSWGRVFYTNFLSLFPLAIVLPTLGEHQHLSLVTWDTPTLFSLGLSCVVGLGMSHASFLLRDAVSATAFTIVGIVCKLITVIINLMIWDKHASPAGIGFLVLW